MEKKQYQICKRCIMDTSDPEITFDEEGLCNHCSNVENHIVNYWFPNEQGETAIKNITNKIKNETKDQKYNCTIGLSGGVDSSYLAYVIKNKLGLNPLAVHVDAGWNSDEAVSNIEKLTKKLGIDLVTIVVNWEEMKDLQLAFLKSQIPNQDIPQDHAFFAGLYNYATKHNIKYVFSGSNFATESILPTSWGSTAMDAKIIKDIHKKFGKRPLKTFPLVSFFKCYIYYPYVKKMQVIKPLNFMPYNKSDAMSFLEKEMSWKYYGGKHHESRFTKFFQSYYLPTKFGFDKRRAHLSSQIMSGEITRDQALNEIAKKSYDDKTIGSDIAYVAKKLGISATELNEIINQPNKSHLDYNSNEHLIKMGSKVKNFFRKLKR